MSTSSSEERGAAAPPLDQTLWQVWQQHAQDDPDRTAIVHYHDLVAARRWRWGELIERAHAYAAGLREAGVQPGQVCALIIRHNAEFYPLYMAVEAVNAIPAVLAYPNPRLHPDKFRQGLEGMSRASGLDWILTETDLAETVSSLVHSPGSTIRGLLFPLERAQVATIGNRPYPGEGIRPTDPAAPCLLQHSSGTTGLQKGVMLSHRAVLEHVRRYAKAIALTPEDRIVSWLPLYHDMGLIAAFHLPLAFGIPVVLLDPFEWVALPGLLLRAIAEEDGTLTWLPNFAYNLLATRVHDDELAGVRLDRLRMLVNCSEPIRADSHDLFAARYAGLGLASTALAGCYAMAETTFAVTQTAPGREAARVVASRQTLADGRLALAAPGEPARACVSSGRPIPGCEVRIVGAAGKVLPDGQVGEIEIRSVSLFSGYRNNPDATRAAFHADWYCSGDYGFCLDGELYVIGRKKDIIIVAGKNIYPEDVEDAVNAVPGVIPGRVVAFGAEDVQTGTECIYVVAEVSDEGDAAASQPAIRRAIIAAGMAIDVTISSVHLVPPRWLIKSSAGKPSRRANKERILSAFSSHAPGAVP